jgi:uncharacterized protein YraI
MRLRVTALTLAAITALSTVAHAFEAVQVATDGLKVRGGPGTQHGAFGNASADEVYPVLSRNGSWVELQFGARAGWAHSAYLRASSDAVQVVTAEALNVRTGPAARFRDVGTLARGTPVVVRDAQGDWRRIDFAGRAAWVHGSYLTASSASSSVPPTAPARPRSRAGFIQLAAADEGFYCYSPASRRWGSPTLVYGIERLARRWARESAGRPRLGVGDLSLINGGDISGHVSHERGVDADFRVVRNDGREGPSTRFLSTYSRAETQAAIDLFVDELSIVYIFFNDRQTRSTTPWPGHDGHFHVRIRR